MARRVQHGSRGIDLRRSMALGCLSRALLTHPRTMPAKKELLRASQPTWYSLSSPGSQIPDFVPRICYLLLASSIWQIPKFQPLRLLKRPQLNLQSTPLQPLSVKDKAATLQLNALCCPSPKREVGVSSSIFGRRGARTLGSHPTV